MSITRHRHDSQISLRANRPTTASHKGFIQPNPYRELPDILPFFSGSEECFIVRFGGKTIRRQLVITSPHIRDDINHVSFEQILSSHTDGKQVCIHASFNLVAHIKVARNALLHIVITG